MLDYRSVIGNKNLYRYCFDTELPTVEPPTPHPTPAGPGLSSEAAEGPAAKVGGA